MIIRNAELHVAPSNETDGKFTETIRALIGTDGYNHREKSSTVQSVRTAFNGWVKKKMRELKEEGHTYFQPEMMIRLQTKGGVALNYADLYKVAETLKKVSGFIGSPNDLDIKDALKYLAHDWCEDNNFVNAESIAKIRAKITAENKSRENKLEKEKEELSELQTALEEVPFVNA